MFAFRDFEFDRLTTSEVMGVYVNYVLAPLKFQAFCIMRILERMENK